MVYKIGDKLPISTNVRMDGSEVEINDTLVITFFDRKSSSIFTCGHCLPVSAHIKDIKSTVIYTSGYDNPTDDLEIARVKVWNTMMFSDYIDGLRATRAKNISEDVELVLRCADVTINGYIIGSCNSQDDTFVYRGAMCKFKYKIPRIQFPFYVVAPTSFDGKMRTMHGFSGAPWIECSLSERLVYGPHVARVNIIDVNDSSVDYEVSLLVPISRFY